MKITISLPSVAPLNLTGAAARSAAASDAAAQSWLSRMQSSADRLLAAVSRERNATNIAEAIRATDAYKVAWNAKDALAPRWRDADATLIRGDGGRVHIYAPQEWFMHPWVALLECAEKSAKHYRETLINAGVPMSDGLETPQYWDDAAARGC